MTFYHGTNEQLDAGDELYDDVCVTDDCDVAAEYGCNVYEVEVPSDIIWATEDDLREAAEAVGVDAHYAFELADDCDVRAELAARGFGGVQYPDVRPGTSGGTDEYTCFRAIDGAWIVAA